MNKKKRIIIRRNPQESQPIYENKQGTTSYEKLVKTPPFYSDEDRMEGVVSSDLYFYIPDEYIGISEKLMRNPLSRVFWNEPAEYVDVVNYAMEYLIYKKYYHTKAVLSKYNIVLPKNPNTEHIKVKERGKNKLLNIEVAIDYWKSLMINENCNIIFIYTICKNKVTGGGHANWTIIDKVRKIVEFYDPHGYHNIEDVDSNWSVYWSDVFKEEFQFTLGLKKPTYFIPRKYNILKYEVSCPIYGPQSIESQGLQHFIDKEGFCMMWSVFLLDMRLGNMKERMKDVQVTNLYGGEQIIYLSSDLYELGNKFKHFIRDYSLFWKNMYDMRPQKMDIDIPLEG